MDNIDRKIVRELQSNSRLTNQELSERINLSPSPCLRRVRQLEKKGIIKGYTAIIDQQAYGMPISAFVWVRLERQTQATITRFERGVTETDEIVACYLMSGNKDYLLQVLSASLNDYEYFIRDKLTQIPGIGELETHFAFGQVKQNPVFPII